MSETKTVPWDSVTLGDVATIQGGFAFSSSDFQDSVVPVVRMSDLKTGHLALTDAERVPHRVVASLQEFSLRVGDVVVGMSGSLTNYAIVREHDLPAYLNQRVGRLCLDGRDRCDYSFLTYVMLSPAYAHHVDLQAAGAAQRNVSGKQIEALEFPLPPLPEQRKIASILTTVDSLIEQTEALIEKYRRVKQGMMADLLSRGVDSDGKLRPTQQQAPELYKQSELGWIPTEWDVESLGDIATKMTNGFVGIATPHYASNESGVPYLYGNNVRPGYLDFRKLLRITETFHRSQRKSQLAPGDMLTVQSGHIGTCAIVPESLGTANCHALIITRFRENTVHPDFVSYCCNSPSGMKRMAALFVGSTIAHINVKEFKSYLIPRPPIPEQEECVVRLNTIREQTDLEVTNLAKLRTVKTGLMQDLLTGKVRVKVDEAEEVTANV